MAKGVNKKKLHSHNKTKKRLLEMEKNIHQPEGVKPKIEWCKLQSGVNW
jgi:hypothetical protein